jgi:CheY-like chemotaxis protein
MICDVELPDGNGLDLLSYARTRYPVQGISLSAHTGDVAQRGRDAGFSVHLSKPFNVGLLREAVANAMECSVVQQVDLPNIMSATGS